MPVPYSIYSLWQASRVICRFAYEWPRGAGESGPGPLHCGPVIVRVSHLTPSFSAWLICDLINFAWRWRPRRTPPTRSPPRSRDRFPSTTVIFYYDDGFAGVIWKYPAKRTFVTDGDGWRWSKSFDDMKCGKNRRHYFAQCHHFCQQIRWY